MKTLTKKQWVEKFSRAVRHDAIAEDAYLFLCDYIDCMLTVDELIAETEKIIFGNQLDAGRV